MQNSRRTFGQVVAEGRKKCGLNLREMAALITKEDGAPISHTYLFDIENDRRNPPSDDLIKQIAAILDISVDLLYLKAMRLPPQINEVNESQAIAAYRAMRKKLSSPMAA